MNLALPLAVGGAVAVAAAAVILFQAERPPMDSVQHGFRGTAMDQIYNPRFVAEELNANKIPLSLPRLPDVGAKAGAVYKNVKVLGNESVGNFTRLMASMTTWVAPTQGCAYCHNVNNMADDSLYTKVVARRMIQMVQHVNSGWKSHVAETGVTCYTCHRGQPVPANIWFNNPGPFDPFTPFLEGDANIRIAAQQALPGTDRSSIKETDWTYSLMIHFSQSLGVNCTYCHNTRSFSDWSQSSPQRVTAWYGIRMARDLNNNYLDPLHSVFPTARLGAEGDSPKVNCATCHNGVYKPLFGVSMVKDFPELQAAQ
jgi:photosynthetic reaction center cytochrome c subunit